jgi:hypothetical protein
VLAFLLVPSILGAVVASCDLARAPLAGLHGRLTRTGHLPPVGRAGCLPREGTLRELKKIIREEILGRGLKNIWHLPPVGWAEGVLPHASRPLVGRELPIFRNFPKLQPFFEFF